MHSAVKIGGERAYKRARRGEQFEMPERVVTVYRFEQLWREREEPREHEEPCEHEEPRERAGVSPSQPAASGLPLERAGYAIECSAGTYVRSLIADLGRRLLRGAPAHGDRAVRRQRRGPAAARGERSGSMRR